MEDPDLTLELGTLSLGNGVLRTRDGERLLTPKELELIRYLARRLGQPVTRDELLVRVWGFAKPERTQTLEQTVRRVRLKLEVDPSNPTHLRTVRHMGYALHAELNPLTTAGLDDLAQARELLDSSRFELAVEPLYRAVESENRSVHSEACRLLGTLAVPDRADDAKNWLERALIGFTELRSAEGISRTRINLASFRQLHGDLEGALHDLDIALTQARDAGHGDLEAQVLRQMGTLSLRIEDLPASLFAPEPGFDTQSTMSGYLTTLARAAEGFDLLTKGRDALARPILEDALSRFRSGGFHVDGARVATAIALADLARGQDEAALRELEQARLVMRQANDREGEAYALTLSALGQLLTGSTTAAAHSLRGAMALARAVRDGRVLSLALCLVALSAPSPEQAAKFLESARKWIAAHDGIATAVYALVDASQRREPMAIGEGPRAPLVRAVLRLIERTE